MVKKEADEWISKADKDLDEAGFLLRMKGRLKDAAYFIQQAIENTSKRFLSPITGNSLKRMI